MTNNKKYKYILLTAKSGINKVQEVFESSKNALDIVNFYTNYFIKREHLLGLQDEILASVPNVVELRSFGTHGYAVPQEEYYDALLKTFKILGEKEIFGKFTLKEVAIKGDIDTKPYKSLVQNTFDFDELAYEVMLNEISNLNSNSKQEQIQEPENN